MTCFRLPRWLRKVGVVSLVSLLCAASVAGRERPGSTGTTVREEFCLLIEPSAGPQVVQPIPGAKMTGLVPGRETSLGVRYLTPSEYAGLNVSWAGFRQRAEAAAARQFAILKPRVIRDAKGFARYAVINGKSHLTASAIFAPDFRKQFRESMGDDLIVLIPDRFTIYVFPRSMSEYKQFGRQIIEAYDEATYPVSYEVFLLNRDGLSCIGSFRTG